MASDHGNTSQINKGSGFRFYVGCIGIMEKKMETTIVYRGYIMIMEKNMNYGILGLCRDNGKENGTGGGFRTLETQNIVWDISSQHVGWTSRGQPCY